MKLWLSFGIAGVLILAVLRLHYTQNVQQETPPNASQSPARQESLARQGLQEMNRITGEPAALDRAIAKFVDALRSDPNDAAALFGLGWAKQVKGDTAEAERIYSQAIIQSNEICKYSHFNLSFIKEKNGDIPAALREVALARLCDPSFPQLISRESQLKSLLANKAH